MKKKKINKKLVLGKATIAHLGNLEMRGVQGGEVTFPGRTCIETCTLCKEC